MRAHYAALLSIPALCLSYVACSGDDSATPHPGVDGGPDATQTTDGGQDAPSEAGGPALKHIFYIMMENHGTAEIVGNTADAPYINQLIGQAALATNYYGVTHPSLPNYLAAISGDFQGIWDDCAAGATSTCAPEEFVANSGDPTAMQLLTDAEVASATMKVHMFDAPNLVDQLETAHLTWKAYMQGIPSVGSTDEYAPVDMVDGGAVPRKLYAQKHDPFMYFSSVRNNPQRMNLIVPFTQFATDIAGTSIPSFVWISPDQCHDMHGVSPANAAAVGIPTCGYPASGLDHGAIKLGDDFLKDTVGKIQASSAWNEGAAIVIVWDEDDYAGYDGCCGSPAGVDGGVLGGAKAPAIVVVSKNGKQMTATDPYNHYSLLATIEKLWNLPCLANACNIPAAGLMTKMFQP
jgi:hypothetical protein